MEDIGDENGKISRNAFQIFLLCFLKALKNKKENTDYTAHLKDLRRQPYKRLNTLTSYWLKWKPGLMVREDN